MTKAIIIGATSGIGEELAITLANKGYLIGITGRRAHLLHEIADQKPAFYKTKTIDIMQLDTLETRLKELVQELGGLDLLILYLLTQVNVFTLNSAASL